MPCPRWRKINILLRPKGGIMATKWTANQLQAINKKNKNILVAAAARKW